MILSILRIGLCLNRLAWTALYRLVRVSILTNAISFTHPPKNSGAAVHTTKDTLLNDFENKYQLESIWVPTIEIPRLSEDEDWVRCNDNIEIDAFIPSKFIFAGRQRKVVSQLIDEVHDPDQHIHTALMLEFPFAGDIQLPNDVKETIDISREVSPQCLNEFWARRILAVRNT